MARIQISNDPSGRIIVSFPYDPLLVEKVKSIDGRRWHPVEKYWSIPNAPYPPHRWGRSPTLHSFGDGAEREGGEEVRIGTAPEVCQT